MFCNKSIGACAGLLLACLLSFNATAKELVFLNWAEYMDPALIKAFEKESGIKVKEVYYESDQARTSMLLQTNGLGYDVVLVSGTHMGLYRKKNWLATFSAEQVPTLAHADLRWLDAFEQAAKGYGAPYLWGSTGILYRKDKIDYPVHSWKQLYQPESALKGRIMMLRDPQDMIGNALKALGYSYNSNNPQQLKQAEALLLAQKPFVGSYGVAVLNETSGFVTGDYWMGMSFNGDALVLKELQPELEFVMPEEGAGLWCDYLTVMQASDSKDAAYRFIDFMNHPENAAQLAQYLQYASTNPAAEKLLPKEFLNNPLIYPSKAALARSEIGIPPSPRAKKRRVTIYNKVLQ